MSGELGDGVRVMISSSIGSTSTRFGDDMINANLGNDDGIMGGKTYD
jgi:hypothetical protein